MAKAKKVSGVRPKRPLNENARRIVSTRLKEMLSWQEATLDETAVEELHNLRIAAKRVRYCIDNFSICFAEADAYRSSLTDIQDCLGDIHDLDVLMDFVRHRLAELDGEHGEATDSDSRRSGLMGLLGRYEEKRGALFRRFQRRWNRGALEQLRQDITTLAKPRAAASKAATS